MKSLPSLVLICCAVAPLNSHAAASTTPAVPTAFTQVQDKTFSVTGTCSCTGSSGCVNLCSVKTVMAVSADIAKAKVQAQIEAELRQDAASKHLTITGTISITVR